MYQIDVGISKGKSNTEKGQVLERLVSQLLNAQQYDVVENIRVTGMEIDVFAKHRVSGEIVLVECKAWDTPLPAEAISKLLGNTFLRKADKGWLVSTGTLSKDAKGLQSEWEMKQDDERKRLSFYTSDRIIDQLVSVGIVLDLERILNRISIAGVSRDAVLLLTDNVYYWIVPSISNPYNTVDTVYAFNASDGSIVDDDILLSDIKQLCNYYEKATWRTDLDRVVDTELTSKTTEEINSIVTVLEGDDWEDYRPARPQDFIGRKKLIQNMVNFFDSVKKGETNTRLFSIAGPSGMGKSSLILKLKNVLSLKKKNKTCHVYALDLRTAISSRYVELALRSCFDDADRSGFTDVKKRDLQASSIEHMLQTDNVISTLEYLEKNNKCLVLIFDQFEEVFSKKELFSVFEKIRQLSGYIDQMQSNLILGFSWKTDLTVPADHPAYHLWSNLSDRRKEFEIPQFSPAEIQGALKVFGSQLGENINPLLRNYLSKQCQGYPWLLKKLCIHIFQLLKEGDDQNAIIGKKLNIVDLFDKDINDLTPEQHKCVVEIAKDSPADYFKILDLFGTDVIQSLINQRIVIRRASRLTLYWDIFRDYVIDARVPNIVLDYIPQQQYATTATITKCLLKMGSMTIEQLSVAVNRKSSTIENYLVDAVMFGIAKREQGLISLTTAAEKEIVRVLRSFFYGHIVYIGIKKLYMQEFSYKEYLAFFEKQFEDTAIADKTKRIYAAKLLNWFLNLGLVESRSTSVYAFVNEPKEYELLLNPSLRRARGIGSNDKRYTVFWGETSPNVLIEAYNIVRQKELTYDDLKGCGYRNAISILWSFGGVQKRNGIYYVLDTIENVLDRIENAETIALAKSILQRKPKVSEREMGEILEKEFDREWKEGSRIRYGSAIRRWARFFMEEEYKQDE